MFVVFYINTKADGCLHKAGIFCLLIQLYTYILYIAQYSGCLIPCGDVNALPTAFVSM